MAKVEKKQITDIILELKFKLQLKGFYSNQIREFFFKPFKPDENVTVKQLVDIFETNGISDKKSLLLARFLIEPQNKPQV